MTSEQKNIFISCAQMGIACGLFHPYEWLMNYDLHMRALTPIDSEKVYGAFLEFFHGCGSCPEDPIETWTTDGMLDAIDEFYKRRLK